MFQSCLGRVADVTIGVARQAPERVVERCVNVAVPPIMEGISAVEQITTHEHVQERLVEQSVYVAHRVEEFCAQRADRTGDRSYGHRHISTCSSSLSCGTTRRYQPSGRFGILLRCRWYGSLTRMLWTFLLGVLSEEIPHVHCIERISVLTSVLSRQVRTIWAVRKTVTVS